MRFIVVVLALVVVPTIARADDVRDYVEYQKVRLLKYSDAVDYHKKTKKDVFVWVGIPDTDTLFKTWLKVKDKGYHVFVKEFASIDTGLVIGRDINSQFVEFKTLKWSSSVVEDIELALRPQPKTQLIRPQDQIQSCPNGRCPTSR